MWLDSDAAGGIDICADTNQYMDFITMLNNYKRRLIYNATNNVFFKMNVNGNASDSLTLNNSTLTTNAITCGAISCTGSSKKPTVPSPAGVYIGLDNAAPGGINLCVSSSTYIDFTNIHNDVKGRMIYGHTANSLRWQVGESGTVI